MMPVHDFTDCNARSGKPIRRYEPNFTPEVIYRDLDDLLSTPGGPAEADQRS
jgi:hypothetical protein